MARGFLDDEVSKSDLHDLTVILHRETDKAWLVSDDGDVKNGVWVPKSQAEISRDGGVWTLTCPEWLAKEKGFI